MEGPFDELELADGKATISDVSLIEIVETIGEQDGKKDIHQEKERHATKDDR